MNLLSSRQTSLHSRTPTEADDCSTRKRDDKQVDFGIDLGASDTDFLELK